MTKLPDLTKLPWPEGCTHFWIICGVHEFRACGCAVQMERIYLDQSWLSRQHYACLAAAEWFRVQADAWVEYSQKQLTPMDATLHAAYIFNNLACERQWRSAALQCERAMTETPK